MDPQPFLDRPPETEPAKRPLRIWPAIVLVILMAVARYLPRCLEEAPPVLWILAGAGPLFASALLLIWWLTASRATWRERVFGCASLILSFLVVSGLVDSTMKGAPLAYLILPTGMVGFALGAIALGRMLSSRRTVVAVLLATLGFSYFILVRNSGMSGDYAMELHWRWQPTPEQVMLAGKSERKDPPIDRSGFGKINEALPDSAWPEFRGTGRSGVSQGPLIASDWTTEPPTQLWKIPVGPGWSSFAVAGDWLFTQEQRGASEAVVCYHSETGQEVWMQAIEARFDDPLGGPGPRATPTLAHGAVFALGAEGSLMRLAAESGEIVWQQDLRSVADRKPPSWGFASSPLVTESLVIVHAGGGGDKGTLAFDVASGDLRWSAASGDHSYSSPQLATIGQHDYVLMLTNQGLDLLHPESGEVQLNYAWPVNNYRSLQPQVVGGDSILLPTGMNAGTRRIRISSAGEALAAEEVWTSRKLKPDFNDFVVFQGHAYGFDGSVFTCIDLATGERSWKGGRYGKGQVLLLANSGLLLVAAEQGEVVLLKASPDAHSELSRFQALDGKTWNHPVVVGDRLYLRNSQEAACYRLPLAK